MNISIGRYWNLLVVYLKPQWKRALLLAVLLLGSISLQLVNPQILRYFIDAVTEGKDTSALVTLALFFLGAGLLNQLLSTLATNYSAQVGWSATNMLRADLAEHCLHLDMTFHNERTPGELIERIDGDVTALANFFSQFVVRIFGAVILIVGVIVVLFLEDWRVGAVVTAYAILDVLILNRMKNIAIASTEKERETNAQLYGFLEERLSGIDDIRANGGGGHVMRRYHQVIRQVFHKGRKAWMMRSSFWFVILTLFTVGDVIALGMGIHLLHAGVITLGTVYLFFQYAQMIWGYVEQITQQMQDLQKAGASIGRVEELMRVKRNMVDGIGTPIPSGPLAVQFDNVTFAYGGKKAVLKDVDVLLQPGEVLGLLGRTGSGKTTITRLLFRLYDATEGTIRLGGTDIRKTRLGELRGRVAMVTQEVQLFHATVRDNLTFFDPTISDERINAVIDELDLRSWYDAMPNGLDTELTAGGGGLSAGEAQLVAFTRVFLRDPGLVILDEPSSRMDLATEQLLERSMQRLLRNRTAIIIAHRLSTVSRADTIMILKNGVIEEYGPRQELAENETSRFYHLLKSGLEVETV